MFKPRLRPIPQPDARPSVSLALASLEPAKIIQRPWAFPVMQTIWEGALRRGLFTRGRGAREGPYKDLFFLQMGGCNLPPFPKNKLPLKQQRWWEEWKFVAVSNFVKPLPPSQGIMPCTKAPWWGVPSCDQLLTPETRYGVMYDGVKCDIWFR